MSSIQRRKFLTTAAALTAGAATQAMSLQTSHHQQQLVHHVFFWLKNPESVADRDKLVEGLRTLAAIPTISKLHIGVPASTEKREVVDSSWQVSELMFFENEAGQKIYQDHPLHQAFIKNCGHLWQKVIVYDAAEL
jgi:aminoglycoside phosphotransferase (APT) family kinase protein